MLWLFSLDPIGKPTTVGVSAEFADWRFDSPDLGPYRKRLPVRIIDRGRDILRCNHRRNRSLLLSNYRYGSFQVMPSFKSHALCCFPAFTKTAHLLSCAILGGFTLALAMDHYLGASIKCEIWLLPGYDGHMFLWNQFICLQSFC